MLERLTADHWQLWRELRLAALEEAPEAFGSRLADWQEAGEQRWRDRLASVEFNLIARLDGRPAGMVSALTAEDDPEAIELISMWVAPFARGRGVGDTLVEAVARHADESGSPRVLLWVVDGNDRAIAFYRRNGFVETGHQQPGPSGRNELQMARRLR
jgi:ribosomal protein S18 acetylase RimI-like enzyme